MVKIEDIDTSPQAKQFADRIMKNPKTYFLNGKWGSGKTEYLNKVESFLTSEYSMIRLELWKPHNKDSLAKKLFVLTYPRVSKLLFGVSWLLILASTFGGLYLAVTSIFLETSNTNGLLTALIVISTALTTLDATVSNSRWVNIDSIMMNYSQTKLKKGKRILIIDDFDRLDPELQKELFLLFNAIHEKTILIFVGDLNNLQHVQDDYLNKIIDVKISLPFSLHSSNIATKTVETINSLVDGRYNTSSIKVLFNLEGRTARDANHFLTYVENEFVLQNKNNKVQPDQQLLVIYLFLFYPSEYQRLVNGWLPGKEEANMFQIEEEQKKAWSSEEMVSGKGEELSAIRKLMGEIFQPRSGNPADYTRNKSAYLVNEFAYNHTVFDLKNIIKLNGEILHKFVREKDVEHSVDYDEFFDFIINMSVEEYKELMITLEIESILALKEEVRHVPNSLIRHVFDKRVAIAFHKYSITLHGREKTLDDYLFEEIEGIFLNVCQTQKIDITDTEKMYFYRSCLNLLGEVVYNGGSLAKVLPYINVHNVMKYLHEIAVRILEERDFGTRDYDAEAVIVLLGYSYWLDGPINPTRNPEFKSRISSIEKLKESEYEVFWGVYNIKPIQDKDESMILRGGKVLEFDFEGSSYYRRVLKRLMSRL